MRTEMNELKVEDYMKRVEDVGISLNVPIQRGNDQWTVSQKSKLIDSMIKGYPVPPIYTVHYKNKQTVIDGLQRTTAIREFYNDKYALKDVDEAFNGKSFSELDEQCRKKIREYELYLADAGDVDDEELAEIFFKLNNGVALSKAQKAKALLKNTGAEWIDELCSRPLFKDRAKFTKKQRRDGALSECLVQGIMLIHGCFGNSHRDRHPWKSISGDETQRYNKEVLSKASQQDLDMYSEVIDYLGTTKVKKNYEKTFIPILIVLGKYAIESGVSKEKFNEYIVHVRLNMPDEYCENTGSGNVFKAKTVGRLRAMIDDFNKAFPEAKKPEIDLSESQKEAVGKDVATEKAVDKKGDVKSDDNIRVEGRAEVEVATGVLAEAMNEAAEAGTPVSPDTSDDTVDAPTQTEEGVCQDGDSDQAETEAAADVQAEAMNGAAVSGTSVPPEANEEAVGEDSTEAEEGVCQEGDLDMAEAMNEAAASGTSVSPETSGETADDAPTQTEEGVCQEGDLAIVE